MIRCSNLRNDIFHTPLPPFTTALLCLGICALLAGTGCRGVGAGLMRTEETVFSGTIETQEIRVGSKTGGRVVEVLVSEGQQVETSQPLVRFDTAELESLLAQTEARVSQQEARLARLERGARREEKSQAEAATGAARAGLDALRTWPRPEEVGQARGSLSAAEAERGNAQALFSRMTRLSQTGDVSQQELDATSFRLEQAKSRVEVEKKRLELLLNGSRREEIRAAEERLRQAEEAERLVRNGPRPEEIADARAQLAEARARLDQVRIQLREGAVNAPARATVEVLTVRPGDLITPNQVVARLLENDQLRVRIFVPEPQLGLVSVGQQATIKIDTFTDRAFSGTVEQINSQGEFTPRNVQSRDERNHQVFGVRIRLDNREGILKAGMAADVTLRPRR